MGAAAAARDARRAGELLQVRRIAEARVRDGYDLIIIGKPTDNSGFGGASFASLELEEDKKEKNKLHNILKSSLLTMQEGGRVLNLGDNTDKVKSMNQVLKIYKKVESKIKVIAVGDNFNDLDMLRNCDIPCLVFNDQFKQDQINIDNLIVTNKPSPEGWADVIKTALVKLNY